MQQSKSVIQEVQSVSGTADDLQFNQTNSSISAVNTTQSHTEYKSLILQNTKIRYMTLDYSSYHGGGTTGQYGGGSVELKLYITPFNGTLTQIAVYTFDLPSYVEVNTLYIPVLDNYLCKDLILDIELKTTVKSVSLQSTEVCDAQLNIYSEKNIN